MKRNRYLFMLLTSILLATGAEAQNKSGVDSTGLPGDNFSLQGALAMFQKAASPEELERLINSQDNHINNLDLNGDGEIDYVRVVDNSDAEAHALVLQAVISENESQDIAVIELEKTGDTTAVVQIVGDEDIYGEPVIVEPGDGEDEGDAAFNPDKGLGMVHGPNAVLIGSTPRIVVNVWLWPSVRFIYAPGYVIWRSPWRWHYYPGWWRPWRPFAWHLWHPYHRPYYAHCAIVHTNRIVHAQRIYAPIRVTSVTVRAHHANAIGNYRVSRTRTTISGPRGREATRTRTTIKGPLGDSRTRTTIRKHR